ncbi:hypothetical protein [Leucobacter sp. GX24907]
MSIRRSRPRKPAHPSTTASDTGVVVPAVLPQILLEAVSDDLLIVTVNGDKLAATPVARNDAAATVTELVACLGSPTRVEVRELDGSTHADILTPPREQPRSRFAPPEHAKEPMQVPGLVEFTAEGFVPGEDVAVAIVLRHASADHTGTARALIDRNETAPVQGEVVLLGRISGTTSVQPIN